MNPIMVTDGSFMLHRARFVAEKQELPKWDYVCFLFIRSLLVVAEQFSPRSIYLLWDKGVSTHRSQILPEYKAHRTRDPNDPGYKAYKEARDFLHEHLPPLGMVSVLSEGIEADDFSHLIASKYELGVHISDDRDWYLNIFPGWTLYRPRAEEKITYKSLCDLTNDEIYPRITYLISKAMVGDQSDNVPGINGIGWGYAKKLAPLVVHDKDLGKGVKAKLVEENMQLVRKNMALMDPSWVLQSEKAIQVLQESEEKASIISKNVLEEWREFQNKFPSNYGMGGWWHRYKSIASNFERG